MSKNEFDYESPISSTYYPKNIFNPYKLNMNYSDNQTKFDFSNTQPLPAFNNIISRENQNQILYKTSFDYDNNYIKERYNKVKQENAGLKLKLFELEKDYKIKKGQMDEQVLLLRDENSNLQLQIQKIIEKQKEENNLSDNIHNENLALINNINLLQSDSLLLKDDITKKVADIEEKNKIINDLRNEKKILINDQNNMKNQINTLYNDKEILIKQIKDLNETINDKISPKLKDNEINLAKLQEQVENLRVENEKLKSDNLLLFNENNIQKNLIQILTKQNKKLLGEIKTIYDRDILLMDNMEKIGSNTSNKYKKVFDKNNYENDNFFEEENNILKDSQHYLNNNIDIKENITIEQLSDNDEIINDNENNININNLNINQNKNKREINSIINNDFVVKRNKDSFENKNNFLNKYYEIKKENNKIYNSSLNNDINKEKIQIINNNILNSSKNKEKNSKRNKIIKRNYNLNTQTFTEGNITKSKFNETDEDIKFQNKTLNQDLNFKKFQFKDDLDINENKDKKDYLYNTDGIINIKNKKGETFEKFENKLDKMKNKYEKIDGNIINENNLNLYKNNINTDENNNLLMQSQNKSQLSEYVEDLDVIQYK